MEARSAAHQRGRKMMPRSSSKEIETSNRFCVLETSISPSEETETEKVSLVASEVAHRWGRRRIKKMPMSSYNDVLQSVLKKASISPSEEIETEKVSLAANEVSHVRQSMRFPNISYSEEFETDSDVSCSEKIEKIEIDFNPSIEIETEKVSLVHSNLEVANEVSHSNLEVASGSNISYSQVETDSNVSYPETDSNISHSYPVVDSPSKEIETQKVSLVANKVSHSNLEVASGSSISYSKEVETDSNVSYSEDSKTDSETDSNYPVDSYGRREYYLELALPRFIPEREGYNNDLDDYYNEEEIYDDSKTENDQDSDNGLIVASPFEIYSDFPEGMREFESLKDRLCKQGWKLTWPKEGETEESVWVNVYSFYDEDTLNGGYGVIVRNMSAEPIAATVRASLDGINYLYQVLNGLDAGLELALKHGCSRPRVVCNSEAVVYLLHATCGCGRSESKVSNVCKSCTMAMADIHEVYFERLEPLLDKLRCKVPCFTFVRKSKDDNRAAHYLAKQAKRTLMAYGWGYDNYKADVKPKEFSDELEEILWKDAYESVTYNLNARDLIFNAQGEIDIQREI